MNSRTYGTGPFPDGKVFYLRIPVPTTTAQLTARKEAVHFDEASAFLFQFIGEHVPEHTESIVQSRFSDAESFIRHRPHIKVFHADIIVLIGYLSRLFLQIILPLVCYMSLELCDTETCFLMPVRVRLCA